MNAQPNEIVSHILSYLDNRDLVLARRACSRWKKLIEKILFKPVIPSLHVCIINRDYYHFGKHYLKYHYSRIDINVLQFPINEKDYYANLVRCVGDYYFEKKIVTDQFKSLSENLLLCHSSHYGYFEAVQFFISRGVPVDANHNFSLHISAEEGHLEIVKYLIEHGANVHTCQEFAIRWAANKGHLDVVKYLVSVGADIHANDDHALQLSAEEGHLDIVKYLIDEGANIHAENDAALRWSAHLGQLEVVKYLIKKGANIHANNDEIFRVSTPSIKEYIISLEKN